MAHHHVDPAPITAALIFMTLAMLLTRVITMGLRARACAVVRDHGAEFVRRRPA
jgi:hypothetical protein